MTETDLLRFLTGLVAVLLAAHTGGALFRAVRLPAVVGEIGGGILLGPTLLGWVAPGTQAWLFDRTEAPGAALAAIGQLGLLLLMFLSGAGARLDVPRGERARIGLISVTGLVLPFAAGVLFVGLLDTERHWGENGDATTFTLIGATAIAVTSIPVISRIMHDLGILRTGFARTVLGVAVVEDAVLYGVIAVAVALATPDAVRVPGLPSALGLDKGGLPDVALHVGLIAVAFAVALLLAERVGRVPTAQFLAHVPVGPVGRRLLLLLGVTLVAVLLGLPAFLGAFLAGVLIGRRTPADPLDEAAVARAAQTSIRRFSFAFFIPLYFGLVGVALDLRRAVDWGFLVVFVLFACVVKSLSVYLGARASRIPPPMARHLSVALNARGGPGIVLATTASAAGIIDSGMFAVLVLLALLTSLIAGAYLQALPVGTFGEDVEDTPAELAGERHARAGTAGDPSLPPGSSA